MSRTQLLSTFRLSTVVYAVPTISSFPIISLSSTVISTSSSCVTPSKITSCSQTGVFPFESEVQCTCFPMAILTEGLILPISSMFLESSADFMRNQRMSLRVFCWGKTQEEPLESRASSTSMTAVSFCLEYKKRGNFSFLMTSRLITHSPMMRYSPFLSSSLNQNLIVPSLLTLKRRISYQANCFMDQDLMALVYRCCCPTWACNTACTRVPFSWDLMRQATTVTLSSPDTILPSLCNKSNPKSHHSTHPSIVHKHRITHA